MSMSAYLSRATALLLAFSSTVALAAIDSPDHILYGNVTVFGAPANSGTVVEVRTHPAGGVLARYALGSDASLGAQFALRIPMDAVDPRRAGFARPGDPVRVFVGGQLAAETSVGADGVAVRLDLDPQSLGAGPSVAVQSRSQFEGNSATSVINFPVQLNTTSAQVVQLEWETANGTAAGGLACTPGVDYVSDEGIVSIAPGALQGSFPVLVCGDATIEPDEAFRVQFTRVVNGVLAQESITATLLDDDDVPVISVAAARVTEPSTGTAVLQFRATLSRSSTVAVSLNYATAELQAIGGAGGDYVTTSGTVTFAPGALQMMIPVTVLADSMPEPPESLRLLLSNPVQGTLAQAEVVGTIEDPTYQPTLRPEGGALGGPTGIATLLQPSDVVIATQGTHAYVASESGDAVLQFTRENNGDLAFVRTYTTASAGMLEAKLDAARDIEQSSDGRFLYVAAQASNGITVLARNATTGDLTLVQSQVDAQVDATAAGGTVRGLLGTSALALSPDGSHLYALGSMGNTLVVFSRNALDGRIAFVEAETNAVNDATDAGGTVVALDRPAGVAVSPDGQQVYVAARFGNALLMFNRDASTGKLSYVTTHRDGQLGIEGLGGAFALALDAQGKHLYVASESDDAVVLFDRAADGSVTRRQQWTRGQDGVSGLDGAQAIALSRDGTEVYIAGFADHSVTVFNRALINGVNTTAGALTVRQTIFDGDVGVTALAGPVAFAVSPDDRHLYVAANVDNAIARFGRLALLPAMFANGFE